MGGNFYLQEFRVDDAGGSIPVVSRLLTSDVRNCESYFLETGRQKTLSPGDCHSLFLASNLFKKMKSN